MTSEVSGSEPANADGPIPTDQPTSEPSRDDAATWISSFACNGAQISVRPLRADDREREIVFVNSLSERSRYLRLMTPLRSLPRHLLDQLMDIDYDSRMAFVASIRDNATEKLIGVARYAAMDEPQTAEIGITVADSWQRHGIAKVLLQRLFEYARARGFRFVRGFVLPENAPMIALARTLDFDVHFSWAEREIHISKEL